jgi:hypothetical protein
MKIIWIKCENHVKVWNHIIFIFFILSSYFFHILGPGTRAWARKRRRSRPGPGPPLWAPKCKNGMKIITKKTCENNEISRFHMIFTFIYIIFIFVSHFWAWDPDAGPKSHNVVIFLVIFFYIILIFFLYAWPGPPVNTAIFESLSSTSMGLHESVLQSIAPGESVPGSWSNCHNQKRTFASGR